MQAWPVDKILDAIRSAGGPLLVYVIVAAIVLVMVVIAWKILTGRKREAPRRVPDLPVDVTLLGNQGPPAGPPILEHYNLPVRLAAIVLAPTGRVGELPRADQLSGLIDHILPGLAQVAITHQPLIRYWPPQLSAEGFAHTFFAQVKLPGDGGKGTPWCSVAGRFKVQRQSFMAGLVMRAETSNNFGQSVVKREHEWLGILRVKSE